MTSMQEFNPELLKNLYIPPSDSHKGQNGKLLVVGGSHLFHAASLWALTVASRIVDMVFYSSVPENNEIVFELKKDFRNGIIVPREALSNYAKEAECILIGPGMVRTEVRSKPWSQAHNEGKQELTIKEINELENEGEQTYFLTKYLLERYPNKKFVLDAGALQMMELEWLRFLQTQPILTPHTHEFETLFHESASVESVEKFSQKYSAIILLKNKKDIICSPSECTNVSGGNAGMTKGGTGDVLAGLVAGLNCKNDQYLSAICASFINKKAGDSLYQKAGPFFNASDLADEIPHVMKEYMIVD